MRNLFAVPWLTPSRRTVLSIVAAVIVVFSIFVLVKISVGAKQVPAKRSASPAPSKGRPLFVNRYPLIQWPLSSPQT